jgi:solute carrier family 25 phosphate transporter 3
MFPFLYIRRISSIYLAIIFRQIPYAVGQFTVNELCHELVFRSVSEETKITISKNNSLRYGVQLGSGIIAGFAAAILSHVNAFTSIL